MNTKVLVVEDIPAQQKLLERYLTMKDYKVFFTDNGEGAISKAKKLKPDIIILDLYLPDLDGIKVCEFLKKERATALIPIIMVTARGGVSDIVNGLKAGADDYICKPYNFQELLARIEVVLRRSERIDTYTDEPLIKKGKITLDTNLRKVLINNRSIKNMTRKEFDLLLLLMKKSPQILSTKFLKEQVWQNDLSGSDTHTVDTHIYSLRKKLGTSLGKNIISVYGFGYKYEET